MNTISLVPHSIKKCSSPEEEREEEEQENTDFLPPLKRRLAVEGCVDQPRKSLFVFIKNPHKTRYRRTENNDGS